MPRLNYHIVRLLSKITPPDLLEKAARLKAFFIVRAATKKIPAYKKFLKEKGFDADGIRSFSDIKKLPLTDKKNYFLKYGIEETLFKKKIAEGYSWEQSSNYDPDAGFLFWPRFFEEEQKCLMNLEFLLRHTYECDKKRTLIVVGFVLGMWSAGDRISRFAKQLAKNKKLKIAVAATGASIMNIIELTQSVGQFYDQIILVGNPYFLRRVIEHGEQKGFDWRNHNIHLLTAGEGFPEDWREFVNKKIEPEGGKTNLPIIRRIISVLGLTETSGSFGTETSLANLIRRLCARDQNLKNLFFGETDSLPMVFQYNPFETFLEVEDGELIITKLTSQPLLRFNSHDFGGICSFKKAIGILKDGGHNLDNLLKKENGKKDDILPLPFVFLYGRNKNVFRILGLTLTVENLQAYVANPELIGNNTGNFKVAVVEEGESQRLHLTVELLGGITPSADLVRKYKDIFFNQRQVKSFLKYYDVAPQEIEPNIVLVEKGKSPFSQNEGAKHHYLKKEG